MQHNLSARCIAALGLECLTKKGSTQNSWDEGCTAVPYFQDYPEIDAALERSDIGFFVAHYNYRECPDDLFEQWNKLYWSGKSLYDPPGELLKYFISKKYFRMNDVESLFDRFHGLCKWLNMNEIQAPSIESVKNNQKKKQKVPVMPMTEEELDNIGLGMVPMTEEELDDIELIKAREPELIRLTWAVHNPDPINPNKLARDIMFICRPENMFENLDENGVIEDLWTKGKEKALYLWGTFQTEIEPSILVRDALKFDSILTLESMFVISKYRFELANELRDQIENNRINKPKLDVPIMLFIDEFKQEKIPSMISQRYPSFFMINRGFKSDNPIEDFGLPQTSTYKWSRNAMYLHYGGDMISNTGRNWQLGCPYFTVTQLCENQKTLVILINGRLLGSTGTQVVVYQNMWIQRPNIASLYLDYFDEIMAKDAFARKKLIPKQGTPEANLKYGLPWLHDDNQYIQAYWTICHWIAVFGDID
jgi:hypothetical protein